VTAEGYTAVFTGLLSVKKPREYICFTMSEDPLGSGGYTLREGWPPRDRMGTEIEFWDLPGGAGVWYSMLTGNCGACKVTAQISWGI
jgi:hypothetical protein